MSRLERLGLLLHVEVGQLHKVNRPGIRGGVSRTKRGMAFVQLHVLVSTHAMACLFCRLSLTVEFDLFLARPTGPDAPNLESATFR